jgi:prevent-host-death family protein
MPKRYSLYEAKARFSAIVRQVRQGQPVIVTVHGKPAVEIRAVADSGEDLEARLTTLVDRGILIRPPTQASPLRMIARRPGGLARFLAERD